ncbi:MAG: ATP-binding protein [Mariprofundaceae bacterium]
MSLSLVVITGSFVVFCFLWVQTYIKLKPGNVYAPFLACVSALIGWLLLELFLLQRVDTSFRIELIKLSLAGWFLAAYFFPRIIYKMFDHEPDLAHRVISWLPPLGMVVLLSTNLLIADNTSGMTPLQFEPGLLYLPIFSFTALLPFCLGFYHIYISWKKAVEPLRQRLLRILFFIAITTSILAFMSSIVLPTFGIFDYGLFLHLSTTILFVSLYWVLGNYPFIRIDMVEVANALITKHHEALLLVNNDGWIVNGNNAAKLMFSFSERPSGIQLDRLIPEYDTQVESFSFCRNGISRTLAATELEQIDNQGRVLLFRDVSEKINIEQRLNESEEQYKLLIEQSDIGIVVLRDGCFFYANPYVLRLLHIENLENILGQPVLEYIHPEHRDAAIGRVTKVMQEGKVYRNIPVRYQNTLGDTFHVEATTMRISYEGELAALTIFKDITEKTSLELQLRQSQKMDSIGTLVGGIAHDFNNMLAGMTGNLYLLNHAVGSNQPESQKYIERLEDLTDQSSKMIKQLMTFARKDIVSKKSVELNELISNSVSLHRVGLPANIAIEYEVCEEALIVDGDISQLQQALLNLINNARDALKSVEQPLITVSLSRFEADRAFLHQHLGVTTSRLARLTVRDNGCGISEDHLDQVFEPFFTTKEVGKGTGLGLAMIYGMAQSHNGVITVDSKIDQGTAIHITLPLATTNKKSAEDAGWEEATIGHGELILLADDDINVRNMARDVLISIGYRVVTASDGQKATEIYREQQHEISLIIMDVMMPILDGAMAARRIRKLNPNVKIIFSTGYDKDATLGVSGGINQITEVILAKPWDIKELSHLIRKQLKS